MCRCINEYEYCNECVDRCVPRLQERKQVAWVSHTMVDGVPVSPSEFVQKAHSAGHDSLGALTGTAGGTSNTRSDDITINSNSLVDLSTIAGTGKFTCGPMSAGHIKTDTHTWDCMTGKDKCPERLRSDAEMEVEPAPVVALSPKEKDSFHKVPVHLFPSTAIVAGAMVIGQGHKKPGRTIYNWRNKEEAIKYTGYLSAALRHLQKYLDGEDFDEELTELAGVDISHLWAALSSLAILIDAQETGTAIDDRTKNGAVAAMIKRLTPALPIEQK